MKDFLRVLAVVLLIVGTVELEEWRHAPRTYALEIFPQAISEYYSQSLTPAASSAAIQTAEQTFTVTGVQTGDSVTMNGPAPTSLCPPTTVRVSAANTIAIGFTTLTAAGCTPAAGTYTFKVWR